jgi:hypothetical protein
VQCAQIAAHSPARCLCDLHTAAAVSRVVQWAQIATHLPARCMCYLQTAAAVSRVVQAAHIATQLPAQCLCNLHTAAFAQPSAKTCAIMCSGCVAGTDRQQLASTLPVF